MSEVTNEDLQTNVQKAIREGVFATDPTRLVTKALVIYECLRDDGTRILSVVPSEDMRSYDMLGFLGYAQQAARTWIDREQEA